MRSRKTNEVEHASAIVDVQLLDVFAEIESLLRSGRELQRELLSMRRVPSSTTREQQRKAAARVQTLVTGMLNDSRSLSKVVSQLRGTTNRLTKRVNGARR